MSEEIGRRNVSIKACDCIHPFQDKEHGRGKRVHNRKIPKETDPTNWRCTVCKKEKP